MTAIKDTMLDILKYTNNEFFTNISIDGKSGETKVSAVDDQGTFILNGKLKNEQAEFKDSVAGLGSLSYLRGLTQWEPFKSKDGTLEVLYTTRGDKTFPEAFKFANVNSGAKASYRLMHESSVTTPPTINEGVTWDIEFVPLAEKINELSQLATLLADVEKHFIVKVEDGDLTILIGEEGSSSHRASLVFASGIEGEVPSIMKWAIPQTMHLLRLCAANGESVLKINKKGVLCVSIDTGMANYDYFLIADSK